jgi:hypothetical protein
MTLDALRAAGKPLLWFLIRICGRATHCIAADISTVQREHTGKLTIANIGARQEDSRARAPSMD